MRVDINWLRTSTFRKYYSLPIIRYPHMRMRLAKIIVRISILGHADVVINRIRIPFIYNLYFIYFSYLYI
jgi:hypothetical protein